MGAWHRMRSPLHQFDCLKATTHLEIIEGGISNRHHSIALQEGGQLPPEPRPIECWVHGAIRQPHEHFCLADLQSLRDGAKPRTFVNSSMEAWSISNDRHVPLQVSKGISPALVQWFHKLDEEKPRGTSRTAYSVFVLTKSRQVPPALNSTAIKIVSRLEGTEKSWWPFSTVYVVE